LFIRDPIEHASSWYQQSIKRAGNTGSIDSWYETEYIDPIRVGNIIDLVAHEPNIDLTVWNYSKRKHDLLALVAQWLDIPADSLATPPHAVVNRSLTSGELEMQRAINRYLGRSGRLVSDRLCNRLP